MPRLPAGGKKAHDIGFCPSEALSAEVESFLFKENDGTDLWSKDYLCQSLCKKTASIGASLYLPACHVGDNALQGAPTWR